MLAVQRSRGLSRARKAALDKSTMPLDAQRAHLLALRNAAAVAAEPHLAELRRRLLACGGDEAALQTKDLDSPALVARGALRGVRGAQARRTQLAGPPSNCHHNAVTHFLRDPRRRRIMTGYYLIAEDPVWRQHSWVEEEAEGGGGGGGGGGSGGGVEPSAAAGAATAPTPVSSQLLSTPTTRSRRPAAVFFYLGALHVSELSSEYMSISP